MDDWDGRDGCVVVDMLGPWRVLGWIVWGWSKVYLRVHFGDFRLRLQSPVPGPYRARACRGWPGVVGVMLMDDDGCDAGTVGRTALTLETRREGRLRSFIGIGLHEYWNSWSDWHLLL